MCRLSSLVSLQLRATTVDWDRLQRPAFEDNNQQVESTSLYGVGPNQSHGETFKWKLSM